MRANGTRGRMLHAVTLLDELEWGWGDWEVVDLIPLASVLTDLRHQFSFAVFDIIRSFVFKRFLSGVSIYMIPTCWCLGIHWRPRKGGILRAGTSCFSR